jgi:hypothetical protein
MSDFSTTAYCRKHHYRFAPDDGGCPHCDDEKRCPACGGEHETEEEYERCICVHEPDWSAVHALESWTPGGNKFTTESDGTISFEVRVECKRCGTLGKIVVNIDPGDLEWGE